MANNARTPEDLERKYNFASLLGLSKNVKMNEKSITKVNNELANMLNTLIINLKDVLNDQGEVSLWFYSGTPTTSNAPYTSWSNKADHYGDIYYDQATGYVYQYSVSGWTRNTDTSLVQAMALTNVELDTTTDHERKVYFTQPTPPYSSGDWWILEDGTLKICQLGKSSGAYDTEDFIVSSKYVATIASKTDDTITVLKGTVTTISDTYVSVEDLATGGRTVINGANITTGTVNTDNVTIGNGNVKLDKEGLKLSNGAKVVGTNGLMNTYIFTQNYDNVEVSYDGFAFCGYDAEGGLTGFESTYTPVKDGIGITVDIPEGLNITSAKVILFHAPMQWSNMSGAITWGYCRQLRLYKATNVTNRVFAGYVGSDLVSADNTTYSEISGALGTSGYTPSTPSASSYKTEMKTSTDIKSSLSTGLNKLLIQTGESLSGSVSETSICSRRALLHAIVKVDGYMSY